MMKSKLYSMMFMLVAGLFTLSFTSCNTDDETFGDYDYSSLLHTWEMTGSSSGYYPYSNVDDVVFDMSSERTLRVFVSPDSDAALEYGMDDNQLYFAFNISVGYRTTSNYKGRLVLNGTGEWIYEVNGSTLTLSYAGGYYQFSLTSLGYANYSTPDDFIESMYE